MKFIRTYVLPFLAWLLVAYAILALFNGIAFRFSSNLFYLQIFGWILSCVIGVGIGLIMQRRIFDNESDDIPYLLRIFRYVHLSVFLICVLIGATPIVKSLKYNLGSVIYLNDLNDLPPFEEAPFLEVENWYADRLRAVIFQTYERGTFLHYNKVYLKTFFLIPMFSRASPYQTNAKSWLAFDYEQTITSSEFLLTQGADEYKSFLSHFKKINVQAFDYFEAYPANSTKKLYLNLAQSHSFFKSGFSNIYRGQSTDRDLKGEYYGRHFIYYLLFLISPIALANGYMTYRLLLMSKKD